MMRKPQAEDLGLSQRNDGARAGLSAGSPQNRRDPERASEFGGPTVTLGVAGQSPALSFEAKICAFIQEACIEHLLSETTLVIGIHQ